MRHAAIALVLAFVAGIAAAAPLPGNAVPAAAAASTDPKVVIIVGAVHGQTDSYRQRGEAAYAEAIKYTPNVVKVFSPNATWSAVKAATQGASIVIYMGHGNGWPSPYTYDPNYTTKNGFGLNSAAGQGDHNNKYYGEPYVSTLDLAPNAIVMLHHLCYAAGSSEPGHAEPTPSVARQRVDNYAAGFLEAGARAVIAEGHRGPAEYLRDIFTTDQSIEDLWRNQSSANGNDLSFASARTPGATAWMDPDEPTSGFYRSMVVGSPVTTTEIRSTGFAGTPFADIASSTFAADIAWLYEAGITKGCSPTEYCPEATVTRGQMASFLARALELPATTTNAFGDDDGTTHETDINRLAASGITAGCSPTSFCPTATVTRGQMASFLARALALPAATSDAFGDDDGTTHETDINRVAAAGLTSGCGPGRYCPAATLTRGQMAAFLHRALGD